MHIRKDIKCEAVGEAGLIRSAFSRTKLQTTRPTGVNLPQVMLHPSLPPPDTILRINLRPTSTHDPVTYTPDN